ncbi:MAG: immunoglobulin domain-containing protein [Bacteroidia bacterium]|nr:immunoglobulin domain-containing protein [Bacteroidia bacterium]
MLRFITMGFAILPLLKLVSGTDINATNALKNYRGSALPFIDNILGIKVQPENQADCKGNKATFSVVAEGGTGPIHYQWQRKRPLDVGFSSFGAKDSTKLAVYNIGSATDSPSGTLYQVTVSDQINLVTSTNASLTVNQISGISPVGVATYTLNQGENLWLKVLTSGNSPLAYQWIKKFGSGDWRNLSDNATLSGSQREQLDFTKIAVADSGTYKIRVSFPTINGNQCTETSTLTRRIYVTPVTDTIPPCFINLDTQNVTLCQKDLEQAEWNDSLSDIIPNRIDYCRFPGQSPLFDLSPTHFSDNLTPNATLILHWGIFAVADPLTPLLDEAGTRLEDMIGPIALHNENIDIGQNPAGEASCRIIYWLEDEAGNLTPQPLRHQIYVIVSRRPEIVSDF